MNLQGEGVFIEKLEYSIFIIIGLGHRLETQGSRV